MFVGIERGIEGAEPIRSLDDVAHFEHRIARTGIVAIGTLACPSCDVPVALGDARVSPRDLLACPYCEHHGPARDFLSLETPVRPTRVAVRITMPERSASRV